MPTTLKMSRATQIACHMKFGCETVNKGA